MLWRYAKNAAMVLVVVMLLGFSAAAAMVKIHHGQLLSVQSGSMVPRFHKGDLVIVTRVPTSALDRGDIVNFTNPKNPKTTITHRIIETPGTAHPGRFITKGDANRAADEPITAAAINGRVDRSVPYIGYAVDFVRRSIGLALIIYVPALVVVGSEIKRLARYYEKQRPYVLPGHAPHTTSSGGISSAKVGVVLVIVATLSLVLPVHAMLASTATLTGNTIQAVGVKEPAHLLISEVFLRCTTRNIAASNRLPLVVIYNPTGENIRLKGWTLRDNSGTVMTLPNRTMHKRQVYVVSLFLPSGLQYSGDHLALYNDANKEVDGLSWGNDTTEFNPSIQGVSAGTHMKRKPTAKDTNTVSDWRVTDMRCAAEPRASSLAIDTDPAITSDTTNSTTLGIVVTDTNGIQTGPEQSIAESDPVDPSGSTVKAVDTP